MIQPRITLCAVPVALGLVAAPGFGATCDSLATLALPATTITSARPVLGPPAVCRVAGSLRPTSDSDIRFEVWLPETGWNGKLKGIGNGGFAGSIDERALAHNASLGYAAAATDTGHRGTAVDASWAPGHPQKVV